MGKKADERLKTENVVNDDICLHLLYGYYGGNLTKTDKDDMKDFVIAQAAGWNRDWSVNLAITALSKIIKDENGTFEDRYDTNAVKLLGIFLREKNVKNFLEFKGITHSCPKLKEAFDCFETIDEFSKYATNALTIVDALRSVMKTAEDIKEAEDNGAAVDYAAAFRNVKDAVVSSLIVFFPSIRPLLTVYSGLIDSIVDSFKEAIYDPLFILSTDQIWEEYENSGDDYKMQLADKIAYTLNMDHINGDNFEWKISDRNLLTIEELEYIYNNNSLNSSQFRDGFGKYTQWRCTEEIYSSMGGKESFEEFQKLLKDLSKDNKFIRNNYDEKSWSDFWKDFIDDKDTGAGSGDSGNGNSGSGDSGNGGNGHSGNGGSGNSGSGHSDDGSSDVTFGDCIDETVSDYIEWMRDHSKTVDDFWNWVIDGGGSSSSSGNTHSGGASDSIGGSNGWGLDDFWDYLGDVFNDLVDNIGDLIGDILGGLLGGIWGDASELRPVDPLILDLDGNGYDISTVAEGAHFDLNNDGFAEMINWTTTDGILAVDKNGNGTIDNGNEVFGDSFVLENGETAKNGFEALSQYDENGDGVIDAKDAAYSQLRVWIDENGDGISQENELYTLTQMGVKSISLDYVDSGRPTDSETVIGHEAAFTSKDGTERNIGEAWVASNHFNSIDKLVVEPSEIVNGLPNVAGFGKIHSLHTAITLDTTGTLESMVKAFTESDDNAERRSIVADILVKLSNAESVEPGSRGRNIDAVQMAVIEAAMGETFNGVSGTDPNNAAASVLKDMYNKIVDAYYYSMIGSTLSKYIGLIGVTENADGGKTYELRAFEMMTMFGLENGTLSEKDFKDLCGYVDFFSLLVEDDHSLFLEVRNFYDVYGDKYLSLVDNSFTNAILGTDEDDILGGTNKDDVIISNKGADEITAGSGSDFIIAGDDNDTVYANDGNDTLDGGKGDDTLYGGYGNDTYIFKKGYGSDVINEDNKGSGADKVVFGSGITAKDIKVSRDGNDLVLSIRGTNDSLRIVNQYMYNDYRVESFELADGTAVTADDIFNMSLTIKGEGEIKDYDGGYGTRNTTLIGGDGADEIYGYSGDDTLDGGNGNDTLYGGYGDDTYIFKKGYGSDVINEDNTGSGADKVVFGEGITAGDLRVSRDGNDLVLSIKGTNDSLRIVNQYLYKDYRVESFVFADKKTYTAESILNTSLTITGSGVIKDYDGGYGTRNTTLIGSNGDDEIYGYGGDDKLDGGKGNDILYGGYGNDTYIFKKGYGSDVINEDNTGSDADRVVFGEGITANDLIISRVGDDLVLSIKGTNDSLRIVNQYLYNDYRVEKFIFANGKTYSAKNIFDISLTIKGEGEIKDFDGGYGTRNTTLIGSDDADAIYGYGGDDTLDGGKGDDALYGGYGDDTYIFKKGYGSDVINEDNTGSGADKVVFGSGITAKDIKVSRDGNDLVLSIRGTNDSLRIVNQYMYKDYRVESFELADGTAVTAEDIFNMSLTIKGEGEVKDYDGGYGTRNTTLIGGDGADEIYGYSGDDTIDGGNGNDTLYGGYGNDTYIFKKGYGSDVINEDNTGSGADKVVFGEGITAGDLRVSRDGNDLVLSIKGTNDSLRIVNQYLYKDYRVESFVFADKKTYTAESILNTSLTITGSGVIKDYDGGYGTRNTTLIGSNGDDEIYGYGGDDKLDGGKGNDILYGGYGNDTYIFKKGYGNDVINEDNTGSTADRVVFGEGITANDLNISRDGDDLVLSIKGTNDSLRIVNQYMYNDYRVEKFIFANGKTYSAKNIFDTSLTIKGEGEIKDFDGGYGTRNTTLIGSDDADAIYGYGGDDTLDGDKGDDTLYGGYGNDTYIFKKGYGSDVINEDNTGSGADKVVFGSGITAKDIKVSRDGNDLVLSIRGTNDSLRIVNQYMYKDYRVESFELADGTAVTADDIFNMSLTIKGESLIKDYDGGYGTRNTTLIGGDGADEIYGYGGDDTIDGGKGNDTLYGGYGNDTYIFKKGYGSDVINEDNTGSGADKVVFGEGISLNDIEATIDGNDLILSVNGTEDTLRIVNHRAYRDYRIESFEFADGTVAEFDLSNNSFNILVSGSDFDEIVSEQTVILDEIYDDSTTTDELTTNEADMLVSELSAAANVGNENNSLSDMTDIQAMILAENMSAFGGGNNVYDSVNNNTEDNSSLGDLFTAAQI